MLKQDIGPSARRVVQPLLVGAALVLLGREALKVEDGQFTREYSRLYTALVLGAGVLLLLGLVVALWNGAARLRR